MFITEQIKTAHSKVKSGADFPSYVQEIKALGVTHYEAYVTDGHIEYHGANGNTAKVLAKYEPLIIAAPQNEEFKAELAAHQQGKTDFLTFIKLCATYGIEKWAVCMEKMTCTYYDKAGNEVLVEEIPHEFQTVLRASRKKGIKINYISKTNIAQQLIKKRKTDT